MRNEWGMGMRNVAGSRRSWSGVRARLTSRFLAYALVGVLILGIGATLTVAAGVLGGVITACYNVATGILRVETTTVPCIVLGNPLLAKSPWLREERITWNQVGPQGEQGIPGIQGPKGDTGDAGAPGAQGLEGAPGQQGERGETGVAGSQGPAGPAGPAGADGAAGPPGADGAAGPQGPTGSQGAPGPQGPRGLTWWGAWFGLNTYQPNDAVHYGGSAYISVAANNTDQPPSPKWELFAAGVAGPPGPAGPSGVSTIGLHQVVSTYAQVTLGCCVTVTAVCNPNGFVVGGGFEFDSGDTTDVVVQRSSGVSVGSGPFTFQNAWTVKAYRPLLSSAQGSVPNVRAWAACVTQP